MHIRESLQDFAPLVFGPHHEGVHGSLDVRLVGVPSPGLSEHPGFGGAGASCWPTIILMMFIGRTIQLLTPWKHQSEKKDRASAKRVNQLSKAGG